MYRHGMLLARALLAFAGAIAIPRALAAQDPGRGAVAGEIVEAGSGAPRPAVLVTVDGARRGALTDDAGRFAISDLVPGSHVVRVRQLGFVPQQRTIAVRAGATTTADFALAVMPVRIAGVESRDQGRDRERFESAPNLGTLTLGRTAISRVPALGEPDVLRAVQLLPGISARNDFSSGYNVRGGESDQNLILLDGYPIYNPFHLGGLFSTFVDETVGSIDLLTGGFGAAYGGRLSSVLDVQSAPRTRPGLHGVLGVSAIASTLTLGSASGDGRFSWSLTGRRTYADKLVAALSDRTFPYHFSDVQLHAVRALGTGNLTLELTAYGGADVLDADLTTLPDSADADAGAGAFVFDWGNQLVGATLRNQWREAPRLPVVGAVDSASVEQRVSLTRFGTGLNLGAGAFQLANRVREARLAGSLRWHRGTHTRRLGYEASAYGIGYDVNSSAAGTDLYRLRQSPLAGALYYQENWRPAARLLAEAGVRGEAISSRGWAGISPRASIKYFISPDLAVSAAAGTYRQWLHSLNREDLPIRLFDFWVASDEHTEVSRARHYVLGVERWMGARRLTRVELWAKQYEHLLDDNPADDPARRGDEFLDGSGQSYGADVLLRQLDYGSLGGWIAYTWSVSTREHDGVAYRPAHDRRHNLNIVGTWKPGHRYTFSARFGLASGTPYTDIVGQLVRRSYDPFTHRYTETGIPRVRQAVGGERNASRYPLFQRLDLGVARDIGWRGMRLTPYLTVVNAYNAKNVFFYLFHYATTPPTREVATQFPLLPSIGMTVGF